MARSWFRGEPVGTTDPEKKLAQRLLDGGLAHPEIGSDVSQSTDPVVVIPVKDDQRGLSATLKGLTELSVIVVDDGSIPRLTDSDLGPGEAGVPARRLLLSQETGGPASARNAGASHIDDISAAPTVVAFVDAGVDVLDGQLRRLSCHFDDPSVVAVAPRVMSKPGRSRLAAYESRFSPLDLGLDPGPVGPDRSITYLPSACLLVRRTALNTVGAFDEAFRFGEDVDLIWRLSRIGTIRYDPSVLVQHRPRSSWAGWFKQRFDYGTSAAQLARKHDHVAAWNTSRWSAGLIVLLLAGRPSLALSVAAVPVRDLERRLRLDRDGRAEATRLVVEGHAWAIRSFAENLVRTWGPFTVVAVLLGNRPRTIVLLASLGWARRLSSSSSIDQIAIGAADDLSYGFGVVAGVLRTRNLRAMRPNLTR